MTKIDWIIHIVANGVVCRDCGKVENSFPVYICNAHTHGMAKYGHRDFQLVLHMAQEEMGYVLNTMGLRVQAGERFKAGDLVEGIFLDCPVRLDEFKECDRTVLRVVIPDGKNRFPEDPDCEYPYNMQTLPMEELEQKGGPIS